MFYPLAWHGAMTILNENYVWLIDRTFTRRWHEAEECHRKNFFLPDLVSSWETV